MLHVLTIFTVLKLGFKRFNTTCFSLISYIREHRYTHPW